MDQRQQPTFTTARLDVFRCRFVREHDQCPESCWDVYLAYEREANDYEYHVACECTTYADDTEVVWVERREATEKGMPLELLNGLALFKGQCCAPNRVISTASERLFAEHMAWWKEHHAGIAE